MSADDKQRKIVSRSGQRPLFHRLGFWVLIVAVGFFIAARPLQSMIDNAVQVDTTASMVWGTIVWLLWIIWLVAAVVLFVLWVVKKVRRLSSESR